MKAAQGRHDASTPRSKTSEFERAFNRLCPTVAEKDVIESFRCKLRESFKQICPHVVVKEFGAGDQALRLRGEGGCNLRARMSNIRHPVSCRAIDIFASLSIPD